MWNYKYCSECKHWITPEVGKGAMHSFCRKKLCMTCREIGKTYNPENDCFERRESEGEK